MRRSFWIGAIVCLLAAAAGYATARALAQDAAVTVAPAGAEVDRVWHLGRVTGDLDRRPAESELSRRVQPRLLARDLDAALAAARMKTRPSDTDHRTQCQA